ncbi:hypothetical protein Tco_0383244 [Tanacetum coccineum]
MMSDHNSSDLAPQRQEMSVENVSSGLIPQGQKASDYDNSDPEPPRQNVVPSAENPDSSHQGLEFLFSPLLEEYYNPTHGLAEDNNNDQKIGESSSRNIDNTNVHSFQPQSHDYRWTKDHPLEQVRGNPTMPVQTIRQLATDPEMCISRITDELHQFEHTKSWEIIDKPFGKMVIKLKWLWKNKKDEDQTCYALEAVRYSICRTQHNKSFPIYTDGRENRILIGPLKEEVYFAQTGRVFVESRSCRKKSTFSGKHSGLNQLQEPDADQLRHALDTRKALLGGKHFMVEKLVSLSKNKTCSRNVLPSRGRVRGVICKLCSSNVDEDTTSRLWLQLQQNTVVLRLLV